MSDILPCDCGHTPELVDRRTYYSVVCNNCQKYITGYKVWGLDHISWGDVSDEEADERNKIVFDAVDWDGLEETAVNAWNAAITIANLQAELAEARNSIRALKSPKPPIL